MPPPLVELRDVTKRYGDGPPVLERITLSVRPGEFVAVIGPSGCGKSTLLRLIAGLSPVSDGLLTVDGTTPEAAAARLGFVFQEPTLLPWLDAAGNIEMPLALRGVPSATRSRQRDAAIALARIDGKADAYPRQLSGGQKMRVSLARALVLQPKLLLLDEPFGALDQMTREHLNEELLQIRQQEGWTAFFVTHSVHEAVFLATRVVILRSGPGGIHAEFEVPLPYPRTGDTRLTREYQEAVARVTRLLRNVDPAGT